MAVNDPFDQLSAALVKAVEGWQDMRRSGGMTYANGGLDAARVALTTYSQAIERLREKPREVVVVRIPRGAPRLRPTRRLLSRPSHEFGSGA